jgi:hydrogenase nickel incorporation protein HypA/HybF
MHELAICQQILETLESELTEEQCEGLQEIYLKCGILSGVEPSFLENAFQFAVVRTIFEGVTLHIERVEVVAECRHCRNTFGVGDYAFVCPKCGEAGCRVVQGNELEIHRLIIEVEESVYEEANQ